MARNWRSAGRARRRLAHAATALLLSLGLLATASACGFEAQLNQPYTPADGTNLDIGEDGALKIRNLVVISRAKGSGIVSASLIGNTEDSLTAVTVAPFTANGTDAAPAPVDLPSPIELGGGSLVVLTNEQPLLQVEAPDLLAGLDANVTLQFAKAGAIAMRAPVVDGTIEPWSTITPVPSGSPSPSPSPSE